MGNRINSGCVCSIKPELRNEMILNDNRSVSTYQTEFDTLDYIWNDKSLSRKIRLDVNMDSLRLRERKISPSVSKDQIRAILLIKEEGILVTGDLSGNVKIYDKDKMIVMQYLTLSPSIKGSRRVRNLYYLLGRSENSPRCILLCVRQDDLIPAENSDIDVWDISNCRDGTKARLFAILNNASGFFSNNLYCLELKTTQNRLNCYLASHDSDGKVNLLHLSLALNQKTHSITRKATLVFRSDEKIKSGGRVFYDKLLAFGGSLSYLYIIKVFEKKSLKIIKRIRVGEEKGFTIDNIVPSGSRGALIFTSDSRNQVNAWDCITSQCVFRLDLHNIKIYTFGLLERKSAESYKGLHQLSKLKIGLVVGGFDTQTRKIGWFFINIKNSVVDRIITPDESVCDTDKFYFSGFCPLQIERVRTGQYQEFSIYEVIDSWNASQNFLAKFNFIGRSM